jgi:hypothetical protein
MFKVGTLDALGDQLCPWQHGRPLLRDLGDRKPLGGFIQLLCSWQPDSRCCSAFRQVSVRTEGSITDFICAGDHQRAFTVASAVTRLEVSLLRVLPIVRLLQVAAPICGDVHDRLLHPARPGRG